MLEVIIDTDGQRNHQYPGAKITIFPIQFGHEAEIHSPDAGQESQRDEDGRHHGELFHDAVHAPVVAGDVEVYQGSHHVPTSFQGLQGELQVVVHIVEERAVVLVQECVLGMEELVYLFLQGQDTFPDEAVVPSVGLYLLDARGDIGVRREKPFFQVFQLVLHRGEDGHEAGHGAVQYDAQQVVRLPVPYFQYILVKGR